jgi:hypothetical protein
MTTVDAHALLVIIDVGIQRVTDHSAATCLFPPLPGFHLRFLLSVHLHCFPPLAFCISGSTIIHIVCRFLNPVWMSSIRTPVSVPTAALRPFRPILPPPPRQHACPAQRPHHCRALLPCAATPVPCRLHPCPPPRTRLRVSTPVPPSLHPTAATRAQLRVGMSVCSTTAPQHTHLPPRHCTVCRRVKTPMCCDYTGSASLSGSRTLPHCAVSPLPWRLTASPPPRTYIRFTSSPSSRSPHGSPRTRLRFATTHLPRPPRIPVASLVPLRSSLRTFARAYICTYLLLSASSCATSQRPPSSLSESPLTSSLSAVVEYDSAATSTSRLLAPSPATLSPHASDEHRPCLPLSSSPYICIMIISGSLYCLHCCPAHSLPLRSEIHLTAL